MGPASTLLSAFDQSEHELTSVSFCSPTIPPTPSVTV